MKSLQYLIPLTLLTMFASSVPGQDNVPQRSPAKRNTKPHQSDLITQWGEKVTPENAWTQYPRPQMQRENWTNLNGHWDYAITSEDRTEPPTQWAGKILVPFCLESKLGGVQRLLDPSETLWYQRTFDLESKPAGRLLLHFEAVDYEANVWVNGEHVGKHVGGNLPFSFDITDNVTPGPNEIQLKVIDRTNAKGSFQLTGKQRLQPGGITYTRVSGIWQSVWMEEVPQNYIQDVKITTSAETGTITVEPKIHGEGGVMVAVKPRVVPQGRFAPSADGDKVVALVRGGNKVVLKVPDAKLWTPSNPHLYDIEISLLGPGDEPVDSVKSYAGIRSVGKVKDANGQWRFTLNGKEIFHWGPLDQGWWPDGLLTPPSEEAMLFELDFLKRAGFNMIRKHIKVEPRRYYYHCDRMGFLVWQDQVSGGTNPPWERLDPARNKRNAPKPGDALDAVWPDEAHQQWMAEHEDMIDHLYNSPSIVVWTPFNERWGQHRTMKVGEWVSKYDPSRLINIASGGNFFPVGDIADMHSYPDPAFPFHIDKYNDYVKVVGEFGGHGYPVKDHLWDPKRGNWGYGGLPENEAEYKERYAQSIRILNELRSKGVAGGVYTQTTDVEVEINGLMTYDRKVIKIPVEELAELHAVLFAPVAQAASLSNKQLSGNKPLQAGSLHYEPGPVMDADTIRAGLKSHDRALYIKAGWIRDPYITLGPDDYYYLTGTQPREGDPREAENPYNIGLGDESIVGDQVRLWRSKDLIKWESLGPIFTVDDTMVAKSGKETRNRYIWAPEVHWLSQEGRWALVHCPRVHSSLALTDGSYLKGPWTHPMNGNLGQRHDPSLFTDDDGTRYLLWGNTFVAPLSKDLTKYTAEPVRIDPAGSRPGPEGKPINRIGHEGATMIKVGGKYVHLGTAWSTDRGRKGSYNLYYCVADKITGPYGPRKFAGRFLGHGTPFQDKDGKWWCTAFFNGNVPPVTREGIENRDLGDKAQTINEQGVTIVPLDVRILDNGEVYIRAKDPAYATPGPDEVQQFDGDVAQAASLLELPLDARPRISPWLDDLKCYESGSGWIYAQNEQQARQMHQTQQDAALRFQRHFGELPAKGIFFASSGNDKLPDEWLRPLKEKQIAWVLPFVTGNRLAGLVSDDQLRAQVRDALQKQLGGALTEEQLKPLIEQGVASARQQIENSVNRQQVFSHELGHVWFIAKYWPDLNIDPGNLHYGGPAADWLDETSAILLENAKLTSERRKFFLETLQQDRNRFIPLAKLFSMEHPSLESLRQPKAPKQSGVQVTVKLGTPTDATTTGLFYAELRMLADFMIERSGNAKLFALVAQSETKGGTMEEWLMKHADAWKLPGTIAGLESEFMKWLANQKDEHTSNK